MPLSEGQTRRTAPTNLNVFNGCRGEPACSPWLNLMALTLQRGNEGYIVLQLIFCHYSALKSISRLTAFEILVFNYSGQPQGIAPTYKYFRHST